MFPHLSRLPDSCDHPGPALFVSTLIVVIRGGARVDKGIDMTGTRFQAIEIGLYSVSSTADNRAVAQKAEARGFRRLWLAEDHHSRDIFVQATAIGTATEAIEIGLGIVNPYTRHPAQIAMAVADLEELAGPRFILGLGAPRAPPAGGS